MKLIWSQESLENLSEIQNYIMVDSLTRAEKFINYLINSCELVVQNPEIGRIVPEISNPKIRELLTKNYRIVYKIKSPKIIEILTVFEGHKLLNLSKVEKGII